MTDWSKILVPIEFSPRCEGAAHYAEALASQYQSELVLLHVVIPPDLYYASADALAYSGAGEMHTDRMKTQGAALENFLAAELAGLPVKRVLLEGDPAPVIARYAEKERCSLIVMPTHGYGPFRRFLLGSVTAKVLHDAHCPVWTGPHMEQAPPREKIHFRRVLCALDFGLQSRVVACAAATFAREMGAELAIAHAIPFSTTRLGGFYFDPEWRSDVAARARERIEFLKEDLGFKAENLIETGEVGSTVASLAAQWNADLLVIGRGHSTGPLGRLRTHAYAILRESPCPVLAI